MKYQLTEIFNIEEIRQLCESFTDINGTVTAILDLEGKVLVATGWQPICTQFHRINGETKKRCIESDTILAGQLKQGQKYNIYKCKNGLVDVAVPIMIENEHVANFFTGQFFTEKPDVEYFREQGKKFGFDEEKYLTALENTPLFTEEQIKKTIGFLVNLTETIGKAGLKNLKYIEQSKLLEIEKTNLIELNDEYAALTEEYKSQNEELAQKYNELVATEEELRASNDELLTTSDSLNNSLAELRIAKIKTEESEKAYKEVVETTSDLITVVDGEGRIIFVNHASINFYGLAPSECMGRFAFDFIHPDDVESTKHEFLEWLNSEKNIFYLENRQVDIQGKIIITSWNIHVERNNNRITKIISIARDITESKQIKEKLIESEKLLNETSQIAKVGGWSIDISNNDLTWTNETYKIHEVDESFQLNVETAIDFYHPEDRSTITNLVKRAIEYGEPFNTELRIITAKNNLIWVRAIGGTSKINNKTKLSGIFQDISVYKKNEKALKESEAKHSSMISNISDVIGIIGADGLIKFKSPNIEKWFGWQPNDLIGTNGWLTVHPDDLQRIQNDFFTLLEKEGAVTTVEYRFKCKNGSYKWIKLTANNLLNNPIIGGILMNYHDITNRKKTEQELKESEEHLRLITNNLPVLISHVDTNLNYLFANNKYNELYGYESDKMVGKNIEKIIGEENLELVFPKIQKVLAGEYVSFENIVVNKNQQERYFQTTYVPQIEENKVTGFFVLAWDRTERKLMENALKESEEKFRSLSENSNDFIMRYDKNHRHIYMNKAGLDIAGITAAQIIGKTHSEVGIYDENQCEVWEEKIDKVFKTKEPHFEQFTWEGVNGNIYLDWRLFPEFNDNNEVISVLGVSRDITYLKQAEINLSQLNADKDRFITILAHDLKNPFSTLIGFSGLLAKNIRKYNMDKIENQVKIIDENAKRTYNLLEDILLWVRVQSGKLPFEPQKIIFPVVCNEVIESLKSIAINKNITINHFTAQEINVLADANMFKTILRNLVSNAIKFTNNNGRIDIYAEKDNSNITISVSDTGIGIEPENLNKLFDISQMLTTAGTIGEKGTGFGLLLCKEFVEKHDGKIWVESELGKGSEFKFSMPLCKVLS